MNVGEYAEPEGLLAQASDTIALLFGDRNPNLAQTHERWAELCRNTGRIAEGEQWLERALEIYRGLGSPGDIARCLNARAELLREVARLPEAESCLREALCVACELPGTPFEAVAVQQAALGSLLFERGELAEALQLLRYAEPVLATLSTDKKHVARARRDLERLTGHVAANEPGELRDR
jgi:tetratricopeptide (TPR) repeat protein